MRQRTLHAILVLTSLFGFLEWGGGRRMFLFQIEWEVIRQAVSDPMAVMHPLIVLPLAGQVLLLISLFHSKPPRWWFLFGVGGLGLLFLLLLLVGVLARNPWTALSTGPFLVTATLALIRYGKG